MTDDLTPRQVAETLGVTVRTVQRWISGGRLEATRVGSRVRVSRSSLSAVRGGSSMQSTPIRSLLIANRGEIAVRIARTARHMGIRVIGVHAEDDRPPDGADEIQAIRSYLDAAEILRVARESDADAVHPGYGFLAENAEFARAVTAAGVRWIGPPSDAIAAMGDKAAARRHATAQGVPTVPGYDGDAQSDARLIGEADRIGYPLLVKPSAGGGGKGMRVVSAAADVKEALDGARREALRSFGNDRLILERYLEGPRHVEIQVLFDVRGDGVHLGERDCSTQRRNQKIVEEAPAPSVTPELRQRMGEAALKVAGAVGYQSAGTVEMLLTDAGDFYFLEMNTRLQVEHPVTEAVIGRDLVADQLRVAGGETLSSLGLRMPPSIRGHAFEARIYAEDPESGFLPATGRLAHLRWPDGVRIDTGVRQGDLVSDRYDPMLAKLIVHGQTRADALGSLRAALAETAILGVRTNLRFLRWLLDEKPMRDGQMRTDTIGRLDLPVEPVADASHWASAASVLRSGTADPWSGGWRLNAPATLGLRHGDEARSVELSESASAVAVRDGGVAHVDVEGQSLEFVVAPPPTVDAAARHASTAGDAGTSVLTSPMPGRVIAVRAVEGATVVAHRPLIVIEAMKMEHAVVAPTDGTLVRLMVVEGQQVQRGDVLAEVASLAFIEPSASRG